MKEITIDHQTAGMRLNKVLNGYLKNATQGFVQKMLRKKNIVVNGKKESGAYRVKEGDVIRLYLSAETLDTMTGDDADKRNTAEELIRIHKELRGDDQAEITIIHEDDALMLINKPAGVLSQRGIRQDASVNEWAKGYLLDKGEYDADKLLRLRPSVANRLDRGTSGLMMVTKHPAAARAVSALLSEGALQKEYLAVVKGKLADTGQAEGLTYRRISYHEEADVSLVHVLLLEGKKHRIRQSMRSIGHPVAGDRKYGDAMCNRHFEETYGAKSQLLHSFRLTFPEAVPEALTGISGRTFTAPLPAVYAKIAAELFGFHES